MTVIYSYCANAELTIRNGTLIFQESLKATVLERERRKTMQRNIDRMLALRSLEDVDQLKSVAVELGVDEENEKKGGKFSESEATRNHAKNEIKHNLGGVDSDDLMKLSDGYTFKKSVAIEEGQQTKTMLSTQQKVAMYIEDMEIKKKREEEERRGKEQSDHLWNHIFSVHIQRYRAYQTRLGYTYIYK